MFYLILFEPHHMWVYGSMPRKKTSKSSTTSTFLVDLLARLHTSPSLSVHHLGSQKLRSRGTWWHPPEDHFAPSSTSRSAMYDVNTCFFCCMTLGLNQQDKYMDCLHCEDFFSNIVLCSIPHTHYKTHQILLRFLAQGVKTVVLPLKLHCCKHRNVTLMKSLHPVTW